MKTDDNSLRLLLLNDKPCILRLMSLYVCIYTSKCDTKFIVLSMNEAVEGNATERNQLIRLERKLFAFSFSFRLFMYTRIYLMCI